MKNYKYENGDGDGDNITTLMHSEIISAKDLFEALPKVDAIRASIPVNEKGNMDLLIDETDGAVVHKLVRS